MKSSFMSSRSTLCWLLAILGGTAPALFAQPDSINLTGRLLDDNDAPLSGSRAWQVTFFDAQKGGAVLDTPVTGVVEVSPSGAFAICVEVDPSLSSTAPLYYEIGIDSATPPDGTVDAQDLFPDLVEIKSVMFAQTVVLQGAGSGLDADALDGMDSTAFVKTTDSIDADTLDGMDSTAFLKTTDDIDADTLEGMDSTAFLKIGDAIAEVLDNDGGGSGLDADALDGMDSTAFLKTIELLAELLTQDGTGSELDADLLDGLDSADFVTEEEYATRFGGHVPVPSEVRMLPPDQTTASSHAVVRRLTWNFGHSQVHAFPAKEKNGGEGTASAISGFRVYQLPSRIEQFIDPIEKGLLTRGEVLRSLAEPVLTSTNRIDVEIVLNSGFQYYYVTAVSADGRESEPGLPFVLNTTPWVIFTGDLDADDAFSLFALLPVPGATPFPLAGDLLATDIEDFAISPTNHRFAFASAAFGPHLLFVTEVVPAPGLSKGGADTTSTFAPESIPVSFPFIAPPTDYRFSPDGRYIVCIGTPEPIFKGSAPQQLVSTDLSGLTDAVLGNGNQKLVFGSPIDLAAPFTFESIDRFEITPDSRYAIFLASGLLHKGLGQPDLFRAPLDGSQPPEQILFDEFGGSSPIDFALSPDGTQVLTAMSFAPTKGVPGTLAISHLSANLTRNLGAPFQDAFWGPTGNRVYQIASTLPIKGPPEQDTIRYHTFSGITQTLSTPEGGLFSNPKITDDGISLVFEIEPGLPIKNGEKVAPPTQNFVLETPAHGFGEWGEVGGGAMPIKTAPKAPIPPPLEYYLAPNSFQAAIIADDGGDFINDLIMNFVAGARSGGVVDIEYFGAPKARPKGNIGDGGVIGPVLFTPDSGLAIFRSGNPNDFIYDLYAVDLAAVDYTAKLIYLSPNTTQGILNLEMPSMGYFPHRDTNPGVNIP